jgi:beta-N-acetylhexosaminidase
MTAHVVYPELDVEYPATMSRRILSGILRDRFHFNGIIFTDDLEMGAIKEGTGAAAAAVRTVRAGADGLLVCRDQELRSEVVAELAAEADRNVDFYAKLKKAAARVALAAYPAGADVPLSFIGSDVHLEMKQNILKQTQNKG